MAIQPDEQYVLKGKQIEDLAFRLSSTGEEIASKAEKAQTGSTAPTTSTPGEIGQLYIQSDGTVYILKSIVEESGQPDEYTWEEVGGGSGPTVVQTTGTSTTDVMSQNATTSMVFADPSTRKLVRIGNNSSAGTRGLALGEWAVASGSTGSTAIGVGATASASGAVALGAGSNATTQGEVNIGSQYQNEGYNSSNYRLLTGLYDPQSAHDAATKGYVDNSLLGKQDALTAGSGISITDESGSLVISSTGGGADAFTTNEWNALWA